MSVKDDIIEASDDELLEVHVPEWKTTVYIKQLTLGEAMDSSDAIEAEKKKTKDISNYIPIYLSYCLCDENGKLLFPKDESRQLKKKSLKVLSRLLKTAMAYHNPPEEAEERGKD